MPFLCILLIILCAISTLLTECSEADNLIKIKVGLRQVHHYAELAETMNNLTCLRF